MVAIDDDLGVAHGRRTRIGPHVGAGVGGRRGAAVRGGRESMVDVATGEQKHRNEKNPAAVSHLYPLLDQPRKAQQIVFKDKKYVSYDVLMIVYFITFIKLILNKNWLYIALFTHGVPFPVLKDAG
jgi:hypothetical protein